MNKPKSKLRLIVGHTLIEYGRCTTVRMDVLECGHIVRMPKDFFGETNWQVRRRCRRCVQGEPADIEGVIVDEHVRPYQITDEIAARLWDDDKYRAADMYLNDTYTGVKDGQHEQPNKRPTAAD